MIQPITQERWQQAQIAEAGYHLDATEGNFRRAYECYFRYLGLTFEQGGKVIAEVGSGPYPAVGFCSDLFGLIFEPLWFARLEELSSVETKERTIRWYRHPVEQEYVDWGADEVWIFNVLQHVIDPELFVSKCKQIAPVIRFFEPIDFGTSDCHPHTFTIDDFIRWFGHAERYKGGSDEGFHTADCAYGTWRANGSR